MIQAVDENHTIAAIATPEGTGAIGIIKISGPEAISVACSIFRPGHLSSGNCSAPPLYPDFFKTWRLYFGHIYDPGTGSVIDEVVVAVMRKPFSYTREDVVEIQAHSGPLVLDKIFNLLVSMGVAPARPGEFTRRAFLNGRIDLTRAEAVSDLINASSDAARDMALAQMTGSLSDFMGNIRKCLITALASVEVFIDFEDEADTSVALSRQAEFLKRYVLEPVRNLIEAYESCRFIREGIRAVIIGRPNVGKSSLLNALIARQRAIVTDIAGTTRDCIEAQVIIRGLSVSLVDTAGLRNDPDPIESLGIEKTWECIENADILLYVLDSGLSLSDIDTEIYNKTANKHVLIVVNKIDLPETKKYLKIPESWQKQKHIEISSKYGTGLEDLKDCISNFGLSPKNPGGFPFVPNWRQKNLLEKVSSSVSSALELFANDFAPELVAVDLREAIVSVDEITGRYIQTDALDEIFSNYCIGK